MLYESIIQPLIYLEKNPIKIESFGGIEGNNKNVLVKLLLIMGDDVGQRKAAGLNGIRSRNNSRYFSDFSSDQYITNSILPSKREIKKIKSAPIDDKTAKSNSLKSYSHFWEIKSISNNYFPSFVICILHLWNLGLVRRILHYLSKKLEKNWTEKMNSEFYKIIKNPLFNEKGKLNSFPGRIFFEVIDHIEIMVNICKDGDIVKIEKNPQDIINFLNLTKSLQNQLYKKEYSVLEINSLDENIKNWKDMLKKICPNESYSFPNWDTLDGVILMIQQFGPLVYYSTQRFESWHRPLRTAGEYLNSSKSATTHLKKIWRMILNRELENK
jgi:uncharacterized protein YaaR (DUF327 family)